MLTLSCIYKAKDDQKTQPYTQKSHDEVTHIFQFTCMYVPKLLYSKLGLIIRESRISYVFVPHLKTIRIVIWIWALNVNFWPRELDYVNACFISYYVNSHILYWSKYLSELPCFIFWLCEFTYFVLNYLSSHISHSCEFLDFHKF